MTANSKIFDFNPKSTKPLIHLAHANGFPPQTYQKAIQSLLPNYHVVSFLARPLWGDTSPEWLKHWFQMADDLIEGIENLTPIDTPHPNPLPQGARGMGISTDPPPSPEGAMNFRTGVHRGESPYGSTKGNMGDFPHERQQGDVGRGEGKVNSDKVIGVGHSLGGVLTLYAAVKRPDLFSRVILIDPTMLSPKLLWQIRLLKIFGLDARKRLIDGALKRKRSWESAEAVYDHFRGRGLFKNWSDDIVEAYVDSMTGPSKNGGVELIYPPEWEAQIYKTIPTDVWKFAKLLQQPTMVIRGETSNTFTADSEKAFRKVNPQAVFKVVQGAGHLVTQEKPEEVGKLIGSFL